MDAPMKYSRAHVTALLAATSLLALAGCGGVSDDLTRTFGLTRDAPDEFRVTTRAPLSMPPDFSLRPPQPGAARPQEASARHEAEAALVPQSALSARQTASSPGQQALVSAAGPAAPANIRTQLATDSAVVGDRSLTDRVLFWRKPDQKDVTVDADRERQRLRENSALGVSPRAGDTPIIQPRQKSFWERLDSLF